MPEPLWDATALGKATINEPTKAKTTADGQDKKMEPVSKLKFQEISEDLESEDLEMQKQLEDEVAELEGIF